MKIPRSKLEDRKKWEIRKPIGFRCSDLPTSSFRLCRVRVSAIGFLSAFGLRLSVFCLLFALQLLPLLAADTNSPADTNAPSDAIPPLRPPRAELPPTYWEQHGSAVV